MYPILTSYLSDERTRRRYVGGPLVSERELFCTSVQVVEAGFAAGSIPNPLYVEAKDRFSRAFEKAINAIKKQYFYPIFWHLQRIDFHDNQATDVWAENKAAEAEGRRINHETPLRKFDDALDNLSLHTLPGKLVKAKKAAFDHAYVKAMLALMTELEPLAAQITDLKNKTIKRQSKPEEEKVVGYKPPPVTTEAQKQVVALLESVTEAAYAELLATLMDYHTTKLTAFLTASKGIKDNRFSPYSFFVREAGRFADFEAFRVVDKIVEKDVNGYWMKSEHAEKVILAAATETADFFRMQFVHKNYRKVASIIEAKGNLQHAVAQEHSVSLHGLEGTFLFCFVDGSHFTAVNQVVRSYSVHGTPFDRFPLTFHHVFLPGGVKMGRPSEERMNTVFVEKEKSA